MIMNLNFMEAWNKLKSRTNQPHRDSCKYLVLFILIKEKGYYMDLISPSTEWFGKNFTANYCIIYFFKKICEIMAFSIFVQLSDTRHVNYFQFNDVNCCVIISVTSSEHKNKFWWLNNESPQIPSKFIIIGMKQDGNLIVES